MYKTKPKCHGCCIMPKRTSLSDVACSSRSISDFGWRLISFNGRARRGFRSAKWPSPTRSGPVRPACPRRPTPPLPMRPLLLFLSHLDFPRSHLPLPLPPLSPCGALGIGDDDHRNLDPEVSSPPFSSLSLPLSLSLLFSPPARAPSSFPCARARPCAAARPSPPRRAPVPPPLCGGAAARPSPSPATARPRRGLRPPARRPGPSVRSPVLGAAPAPARSPLRAASTPCARPSTPARGVPAPARLAWPRLPP
jgi:hypothetical protein